MNAILRIQMHQGLDEKARDLREGGCVGLPLRSVEVECW